MADRHGASGQCDNKIRCRTDVFNMRIFTSDGQRLAGFGASRRVWYPGRTHEVFACGTLQCIHLLACKLVVQPFSTVWRLFHVAVFLPPRLLRIRYADVVHMLRELVRRDSLLGSAGTDRNAAHTAKNAHESNRLTSVYAPTSSIGHCCPSKNVPTLRVCVG